ncbi:hypothetical protein C497_00475 [Halalkalicoccus jeotgali B3]|uniref:Uncharacterized protein n=1 Tax=Halalkalicoccus jeotgali (strain DSM 18796 / CECT 7217 / JCM 14584 / KCTC 4019 / B3) TaxID=795797 RepID=D8JCM2_HALJB|nr:hypothetical protein HacjB3_18948 [Halalkalicoccus jeotgali B3]ELY41716.1 hypothetical protein C497_00475 [Halalkalicoccus jeotgali B3]
MDVISSQRLGRQRLATYGIGLLAVLGRSMRVIPAIIALLTGDSDGSTIFLITVIQFAYDTRASTNL